jgi:hypothetical protein
MIHFDKYLVIRTFPYDDIEFWETSLDSDQGNLRRLLRAKTQQLNFQQRPKGAIKASKGLIKA